MVVIYYIILGGLRAGVHVLPHGHDGPLAVLVGRRNSSPGVGACVGVCCVIFSFLSESMNALNLAWLYCSAKGSF